MDATNEFKQFDIPADPFGNEMLTFRTRLKTGSYPDGKYPPDLVSLINISEELTNVYLDGQLLAKDFIRRMADTEDYPHQFFKKHFEDWVPGCTEDIDKLIACLDDLANQSIYLKKSSSQGAYFIVDGGY